MPTLLFRDTFAEDANLVDHTPTPNGGPAWEYDGTGDAYTCHAAGYLDGVIAASTPPARNVFAIPTSVAYWRIQLDISRGGVDFVGGGFTVQAYCSDVAIGSYTTRNLLSVGVGRRDAGSVQFAALFLRPLIPAGPDFVVIRSANILHAANTSRRYIVQVNQQLGTVELFVADAITGANELSVADAAIDPPTGDGLFTDELATHIATDTTERLIGVQGGWSASGQVYFSASDLRLYELELPPEPGAPCTFLLTVYDSDGITTLWEVATDPAHSYPILCEPESLNEQELDIAKGAATVGSVRVSVIDKPTLAGDQDSGQFTEWLASLGLNAIGGRRMRLIRFGPTGDPVVIMDGPASNANLDSDYASFSCEIRDTRDTERKLRLFDAIGVIADEITGVSPTAPEIRGTQSEILWNTENH